MYVWTWVFGPVGPLRVGPEGAVDFLVCVFGFKRVARSGVFRVSTQKFDGFTFSELLILHYQQL